MNHRYHSYNRGTLANTVPICRWLIVFAGGLIALYGAHLIHYDGAGGLAAILLSLIASMQWRREGWGEHNPVSEMFNKVPPI